jgi:hypothetical protein
VTPPKLTPSGAEISLVQLGVVLQKAQHPTAQTFVKIGVGRGHDRQDPARAAQAKARKLAARKHPKLAPPTRTHNFAFKNIANRLTFWTGPRKARHPQRHYGDLRDTNCGDTGCHYCRINNDPKQALRRWFGFESFRPEPVDEFGRPLQERIVERAMAGESLLEILAPSCQAITAGSEGSQRASPRIQVQVLP